MDNRAMPIALLALATSLACSNKDSKITLDAAVSPDAAASVPDGAMPDDSRATEAGAGLKHLTYWQDIVPIVENKCMGCHQPGGIAPFSMGTYAETKSRAPLISSYVSTGVMPPYYIKHDGTCGTFDDGVALTAAETETLVAWASGTADEGTASSIVVPPIPKLQEGTAYTTPVFAPVAQGTTVALYDEYRCFLVDPGLAQDRFVTGYEVTPGNAAIVHHIIGFAVDPSAPGDTGEPNSVIMQRLHDASPGREGWPCFGAAGDSVSVAGVPVEWAPGQGVVSYPDGMGFQMKSSYRYVIQVHYNLADPQSAGQQDSSTMRVRYTDAVNRRVVFFLPDGFLDTLRAGSPDVLAPGQASVVYRWHRTAAQLGVPSGLPYVDLVGVGPHMHTRGIGQELDIGSSDGPSACASELTHWDFHWQKFYFYKPGNYPRLTQTSFIDVACTYDTQAETAPVLPGWGTRNEMCLTVLMVALPPGV
jgi:hypothetical protein